MSFTYLVCKFLFRLVLRIFFQSIEIIGQHHIPKDGPIIFVGNHNNQFLDPLLVMTSTHHEVGFIIAAKSLQRPIIGFFARAVGSIGVRRPQDEARKAVGKICSKSVGTSPDTQIVGIGTRFTQDVKEGESLAVKGYNETPRVLKVISDTELILKSPFEKSLNPKGEEFTVRPDLDHSEMYNTVWNRLRNKGCIGIFPEGGSHDRKSLLELKGGVCLMALGAMDLYPDCKVCIVPCGLNYFSGHKFRSHVFVEFGHPYYIPYEMVQKYKVQKREAVAELLNIVKKKLKNVTLNFPDLQSYEVIQCVRRLYQPEGVDLSSEEFLKLNRRFAKGYAFTRGKPGVAELEEQVREYAQSLRKFGLKDYQIAQLNLESRMWRWIELLIRIGYLVILLAASLPGFLINLPVGLIAKYVASKEATKALKASSVKVKGLDVVASQKVLVSAILIPITYGLYSAIVFYFYGWLYAVLLWPVLAFFSYASIRIMEEGLSVWKSSTPLIFCVSRSYYYEELVKLQRMRKDLKKKVRKFVEEFGPQIGTKFWKSRVIDPTLLKENDSEGGGTPLQLKFRKHIYKARNYESFEDLDLDENDSSAMLGFKDNQDEEQ